jgi:hypothetical protein
MIGACLLYKHGMDATHTTQPFVVAQTNKGNWVWVDENEDSYGILTPAQLENDWEIVDVFPPEMFSFVVWGLKSLSSKFPLNDGTTFKDYLANN